MKSECVRRFGGVVLAGILLVCLMGGCGGGEGVSSDPAASTSSTTTSLVTTMTSASASTTTTESETSVESTTETETAATDSTTTEKPSTTGSASTTKQSTTKTTTTTKVTTASTTQPLPKKELTEIGIWYSTWYGYGQPGSTNNQFDTWNAWGIESTPLLPDGSFGRYDSLNESVMQFHLEKMSEAQIDFIIMDQTNRIDADNGYINKRSLAMAKKIKQYNDSGARPVRYCSAIGAVQWDRNGATIEQEARMLWERYVTQDFGGEKYHMYYEGKPLLIVYGDAEDIWNSYTGDKTYGNKFTIRFAGNNSTPGYWGWAYDKGVQWHPEVTVVMPGWHNRAGHAPVNRNYGETYKKFWRKVLNEPESPRFIVINSFNEYAERTAVFPAVISDDAREGDKWYTDENRVQDPYMYWNMTVDYIQKFKAMDKPLADF